jgi:hypothetical protein
VVCLAGQSALERDHRRIKGTVTSQCRPDTFQPSGCRQESFCGGAVLKIFAQAAAHRGGAGVRDHAESETKRAILSVIAIAKGLRTHAKFLVAYSRGRVVGNGAMMSEIA